jgi:uncharacterized protein (TIGR00369 family)
MFQWSTILDAIVSGKKSPEDFPSYTPCADYLEFPILKSWSAGRILADFPISEKYHNSRGHLFGGYFGVLADMTFCFTVMTVLKGDEGFSTSDLRITYFRPVSKGILHIEGRVLHHSRKAVHVEALFNDDEERLVAKGDGIMSIVPMSAIYPKKE